MKSQLREKFWRLTAQESGKEPTAFDLMIFSALGDPWSEETVWARKFTEDLWALPKSVKRLNLHINSPGGSVAEAQAIYSALADHQSEKVVYIDGIAASAATIPAMAGHKVYIRSNANMMIHLPSALVVGNSDAMREAISMLESVTESIVNVYQKKSGLARDKIRELMSAETWFTAQQAVEHGFADEVRGVIKAAASLEASRVIFNGREFDLGPYKYRNVPAFPEATTDMKTKARKSPPAPAAEPAGPQAKPQLQPEPKPSEPRSQEEEEESPGPLSEFHDEVWDLMEEYAPTAGWPGIIAELDVLHDEAEEQRDEAEAAAGRAPEPDDVAKEVASIWKKFPRAARAIRDAAIQFERARVAAFDELNDPAGAAIVAEAKTGGKSVADIAISYAKALTQARARDVRLADASILDGVKPGEAPFQPIRPAAASANNKDRSKAVSLLVGANAKTRNNSKIKPQQN